jgi:tetratricopeptide (TPR) repeat protein
MTVVEWHPDELFDKQKAGSLSQAESRQLDEHLAECAACRIERQAVDDFALELQQVEHTSLSRMVSAAVAERTPRPHRRRKLAPIVLAALALLATASAAALYRSAQHEPAPLMAPAFHPVLDSVLDSVNSVKAEPTAAPSARVEADAPAAPSASAAPPASELFAAANQARRRGQRDEALRLYRELARRYPDSPEAQLSNATVGRMLLDGDNPQAALDAFDRYLAQGGNLSEEALVGRALALQKLGRQAEERAAWEALLRAHPSSIHAARARARLAAPGSK